ncbi:uncharacterized protein LOC112468588 [Temnothorax curvispinosus]|uniref:Uncharacterized protein LOC112468588 n=1 Tax=Temnothorax curvispinosus TaxID=300111 RepID=A0A6J1RGY2_9HYME|nr:uncharacterized protein LOC112468588 [Temnothorax curvispinosus]
MPSSFSAEMNGTVHYAMVALREKSDCKIIADYSVDPNPIYRTIALGTIDSVRTEDDKISVDKSRYTVHILIGDLYYVCLTSKVDCPSSAIWVESCCQIFLQRVRSVYKELPLADLSKNLINLVEDDLSKPLKKMIEEYNQGNGCKNLTSKLEEELVEVRRILMNGVQKLIDRGERLDELIRKTQNLEISAWFRGIITRNHVRKLHENATVLQRHWRGYHARMFINQYLAERVRQMWQHHYNNMATRIQAVWRGYWSRKTQINFLQLQQWLRNVYTKNNETLENMKKFRQGELEHAESVTEQEAMLWILFILFKVK